MHRNRKSHFEITCASVCIASALCWQHLLHCLFSACIVQLYCYYGDNYVIYLYCMLYSVNGAVEIIDKFDPSLLCQIFPFKVHLCNLISDKVVGYWFVHTTYFSTILPSTPNMNG